MFRLLTLLLVGGMAPIASAQDNPALRSEGPVVGAVAPEFALRKLESEEAVSLATLRAKRPVVLVFGSYT